MSKPGSAQARIRPRLLAAVAAAALVVLLTVSGASTRLDTWYQDAFAQLLPVHADPRIVLVEIDRASLARIGRWPWSRRVHARLLERLTAAGVRGVALNVLLSEPALFDPEGDALLARAIDRSGKVVLPVYATAGSGQGSAVELLPIREFVVRAAALGHVDQSPDQDGKTRSLYLHAGVGTPRWPAMALAMQQLDSAADAALDALAEPDAGEFVADDGSWQREGRVMLPAAQGRSAYQRFSYSEVLDGRVPAASLRGRWIVVSPVVAGLGPATGNPDRNRDQDPFNAAQFQLRALDALVQERGIVPLSLPAQIALSALLVTLPLLLTGLPRLRSFGRTLLIALAATPVLTWLLLVGARTWFAPGAAILVLSLASAAWAARRLREVRRAELIDPLTGLANRRMFTDSLQQELRSTRRSGQPLSLLLIELDQFREAEHSQDRKLTDAMVRRLADNLRSRARRPRDTVARMAGGRFAILLPETTTQAAAAIATTIHVDLANAAMAQGSAADAALTASIGMHTVHGQDGAGSEELVARADAARARAGLAGGNRTSSFGEMAAGSW